MIKNILSIAGSDPSGGAGIQADLKTISALGGYGMSVITCLTAQNTQGVTAVHVPPINFLEAQIRSLRSDIDIAAIKIGMLANAEIIECVARLLSDVEIPIILDPVMVATSGDRLLDSDAVDVLISQLVPLATVLTPNLHESAALLGTTKATTKDQMRTQAYELMKFGSTWVYLKGGHLEGTLSPDLITDGNQSNWLDTTRIKSQNTHGTGCTLSSAIATLMGQGEDPMSAAEKAKAYISGAILASDQLCVGKGSGPVHHFHRPFNP